MEEENLQQERKKTSDEVFCRSCGEIIKKETDICPYCGVRNIHTMSSNLRRHDSIKCQTSVSGIWYYVILLCTIVWIILLLIPSEVYWGEAFDTAMGFFFLLAWIGLPISIYYDIQYIRANNTEWNPSSSFWVIGGLIWILNLIIVFVYLLRRRESMS